MAMSLWWWIKNIEFESLFTPWVFRADYGPKLSKTTALQRPEKVEINPHANPIEWLALYIRPDLFLRVLWPLVDHLMMTLTDLNSDQFSF